MITTAYVKIWNRVAGAVAWDDTTGTASFEFEPAFLRKGLDLSPLMMPRYGSEGRIWSFPQLGRSEVFKGLPGLLSDSLPDRFGNALIDAWLASHGRPAGSMNPVEVLCYIGKRGMGALEFEPPLSGRRDTATKIEISEMVSLANLILSGRSDFQTDLTRDESKAMADILKIGTSAGGARAKAVIAYNPGTGEVRSGQASAPAGFSHWILKFDGVADSQLGATKGYGRVEMAYHLMALACGIEMTRCRLLEENGRAHFMTRRFDRTNTGEKLHMQSFCAMRHFDFSDISSFGYEQLFETARLLRLPYPDSEQLFLRMIFNVLARNCDDHTKNFAFIMDKEGRWSLAPAFDLCHTYNPSNPWVSRQALSVNGKRSNIGRDDFLQVARQMNVKKAASLIARVNETVQDWDKYAKETGVENKLRETIKSTLLKLQ
jgi:serine/threonine-protein kinase HipA